MEATVSAPWMCEMSKHSMRRGQLGQHERIGLQRFLNGFARGLQDAEALVVGLLGVLPGEVDERALVAALRHGELDAMAGALASRRRRALAIGEVDGDEMCAGRTAGRCRAA
jgi:hypothetical protein